MLPLGASETVVSGILQCSFSFLCFSVIVNNLGIMGSLVFLPYNCLVLQEPREKI